MNYHAIIGTIFSILMFSAVAHSLGKILRNRPWTSFGIGFIIYFILLSVSISSFDKAGTGIVVFVAYLMALSVVVPIIIGLNDKRPRCCQCGSVLNQNAKICHACHTPIAGKVKARKEATIDCPECNKPIPERIIKTGVNYCPYCKSKFECL